MEQQPQNAQDQFFDSSCVAHHESSHNHSEPSFFYTTGQPNPALSAKSDPSINDPYVPNEQVPAYGNNHLMDNQQPVNYSLRYQYESERETRNSSDDVPMHPTNTQQAFFPSPSLNAASDDEMSAENNQPEFADSVQQKLNSRKKNKESQQKTREGKKVLEQENVQLKEEKVALEETNCDLCEELNRVWEENERLKQSVSQLTDWLTKSEQKNEKLQDTLCQHLKDCCKNPR
ncbi:hypothetical protein M3Y95_01047900 [Aphelenchoides besseyi]|nr:hypothetical protein M3Y95_01047900 [Aphelenchoides besseyi]